MKVFLYNIGYFLKETKKLFALNLLSNLLSMVGTGLIFFLLGLVFTGGMIGERLVDALSSEAEISVYYDQQLNETKVKQLQEKINQVNGVRHSTWISEEQARERMKELLGEEGKILELFHENPLEAYYEVAIVMEKLDSVTEELGKLEGVVLLRDNQEILSQMYDITKGLEILGLLILGAVGITTVILVSHLVRQGIYHNKEEIHTLRQLGAGSAFIGFPFVLAGTLQVAIGALLGLGGVHLLLGGLYENLGQMIAFLPLPAKADILTRMNGLLSIIGAGLGFLGSLLGLSSIGD